MKRRSGSNLFFAFLFFYAGFSYLSPAFGADQYGVYPIDVTTGTIQDIRRNHIILLEDSTKKERAFVYVRDDIDRYKIGDRIRIYYRGPGIHVESIQKLTRSTFNAKDQNLGYLYGSPLP